MIDLGLFFTEDELNTLFEKWSSEAQQLSAKKAKYDEYMRRINEAKAPYEEERKRILKEKEKKGIKAELSLEERIKLWEPFYKQCKKITQEIYGSEKCI